MAEQRESGGSGGQNSGDTTEGEARDATVDEEEKKKE